MLRIRLQRVGRKNIPIFRVVLTDKRNSTKSGRYLETLGSYDPRKGGIKQFDADKIKHWLSKGAKLTDTLHNLFINEKIIEGKKINVLPRKSPIKKDEKKEDTNNATATSVANASSEEAQAGEQAGDAPVLENKDVPAPAEAK